MKPFATLALVCLALVGPSAYATPLNPLSDGYTFTVDNTAVSDSNASYNSSTGTLSFTNATSTYTFLEASAAPLINAISITRVCLVIGLPGCASSTVSVSDASLLHHTLEASALVGATLQASAYAGAGNLTFASTVTTGAQSALLGFDPSSNSPVPEPGTVTLVLSGVLTMAGAARKRLLNA